MSQYDEVILQLKILLGYWEEFSFTLASGWGSRLFFFSIYFY